MMKTTAQEVKPVTMRSKVMKSFMGIIPFTKSSVMTKMIIISMTDINSKPLFLFIMIIIVVMDCSTFAANVEKLELLDDDFAGVRALVGVSYNRCK